MGQAYACEEKNMATIQTTTNPGLIEEGKHSAVNWGAVIAGSVTTAALTLVLLAFGAGVGFSVVSPWADSGVSAATFSLGAGRFLIAVAMLSSTIGGFIAGRLRTKCADRQRMVALDRFQHSAGHNVVAEGCRQSAKKSNAQWHHPKSDRFRRRRLRRPVPAGGPRQAPLSHHSLCRGRRQAARCHRRYRLGGAGRL